LVATGAIWNSGSSMEQTNGAVETLQMRRERGQRGGPRAGGLVIMVTRAMKDLLALYLAMRGVKVMRGTRDSDPSFQPASTACCSLKLISCCSLRAASIRVVRVVADL